ncbi:MAG TPA: hypothetical protein VFM99_05990, partial [Chitinophagales bacterium]|nr:hypothetical protein [Chitinophagales bacterium]
NDRVAEPTEVNTVSNFTVSLENDNMALASSMKEIFRQELKAIAEINNVIKRILNCMVGCACNAGILNLWHQR